MNTSAIMKTFLMANAVLVVAWGAVAQAPDLENMDLVLKSIPDGPVAKVDGVNLGKERFVAFYLSELARATERNGGKEIPDGARVRLALWCLGRQIEDEVLCQEARRRKLTASRESIERTWGERVERLRKGLAHQRGREVTEAEVLAKLGFERRDDVLADIERFLLIGKCRAAIIEESGLTIEEGEVTEVYGENRERFLRPDMMRLRQIYLRVQGRGGPAVEHARAEGRKRAGDALGRIQAGQSFEGVARTMSEGPAKESGGDMGLVPVNQLPPFLVEAALKLDPGETSGIIESEYGFHIIKVVDIVPGSSVSLDEAAPIIRGRLASQKGLEIVRDYCDGLLSGDMVVLVFLDLEKTLSTNPAYQELKL